MLVRTGVAGDDFDAAIGEALELREDVSGRLRLDDIDLLVGHGLHGGGRVTDDRVHDGFDVRLRAPRIVGVRAERHLRELVVAVEQVRAGAEVQTLVGG